MEKANAALRSENAMVEDLEAVRYSVLLVVFFQVLTTPWLLLQRWQNYSEMVHEEHRQLAIANEDAKRYSEF